MFDGLLSFCWWGLGNRGLDMTVEKLATLVRLKAEIKLYCALS